MRMRQRHLTSWRWLTDEASSPQRLDRRVAGPATLRREVAAWEQMLNDEHDTASSHFTAARAREKLEGFYPA
jgi:hypothetical protein